MGYDIRILLSAHLRILWTIGHRKSNSNGLSGRILHLKSEIRHLKLDDQMQGPIRNFEFEMQDSPNFQICPLTSA
ncbi:MAG: hypothetical protein DMG19_11740 [Acidobacteria bacterium]|nr:MAG: hypothetical protein DMG19_11740 [Acidobacteriota bacterium]